MVTMGMLVDVTKCIGCKYCTVACPKACPTSCISFGKRDDLAAAKARVAVMKQQYPNVQTYGGKGTNVIYVLKEKPEFYGLPKEPGADAVMVWKDVIKPLTGLGLGATVIGLVAHAVLRGRDDYREEGGKGDE